MSNNNIVKIGTALKFRGDYSSEKTYYKDNIVTSYCSIFRCKATQTTGNPPVVRRGENSPLEFANTEIWDLVVDNTTLVNLVEISNQLVTETQETANEILQMREDLSGEFSKVHAATLVNVNAYKNSDEPYNSIIEAIAELGEYHQKEGVIVLFKDPDDNWQAWQWKGGVWNMQRYWSRLDDVLRAVQINDATDLEELESHGRLDPNKLYFTAE